MWSRDQNPVLNGLLEREFAEVVAAGVFKSSRYLAEDIEP